MPNLQFGGGSKVMSESSFWSLKKPIFLILKNQSINQSINALINWSTTQTINQSIAGEDGDSPVINESRLLTVLHCWTKFCSSCWMP
jgi:hypothetical protein